MRRWPDVCHTLVLLYTSAQEAAVETASVPAAAPATATVAAAAVVVSAEDTAAVSATPPTSAEVRHGTRRTAHRARCAALIPQPRKWPPRGRADHAGHLHRPARLTIKRKSQGEKSALEVCPALSRNHDRLRLAPNPRLAAHRGDSRQRHRARCLGVNAEL